MNDKDIRPQPKTTDQTADGVPAGNARHGCPDSTAADAATGAAASPPADDPIAHLTAELEAARAEAEKMRDQMLRALAEADNIRKRAEREKQDTAKYAVSAFAKDLVEVAENLHRALAAAPADQLAGNELANQLAIGVSMTERQLADAFAKHGLTRIDPMGEPFDPNYHQAMYEVPDPSAEPGTVVHVVQAGYILNERLLKPALVGVAKGERPKVVDTEA